MNLATQYLGLRLRSPFIVGASPFCDNVDLARALEEAGAGALVMRSLFEEQIDPAPRPVFVRPGELAYYPDVADYQLSPENYLRQLALLKQTLSIPIFASLNGTRPGMWIEFASCLESAGADAIELNFYRVVTDVSVAADRIEIEMLETVGLIAEAVSIPVAVKLSPFHTALTQLAVGLELAGASGLVLFNRFLQPDVDTGRLEVHPHLQLSSREEILLRLRWLAILSPNLRGSLGATGGFHCADDAVKALLTGANAVQVVSVLLSHGPAVLTTFLRGLETWMRAHGYAALEEFRGRLNLEGCGNPSAFERANYIRTLQSWKG